MDRIATKNLILQLEKKNREDLEKERWGKKIVKLVRDQLYSEKTHFILELIQNADDCDSKTLEFYLTRNDLRVINYGGAFTEVDVKDLSDFEESHKGPEHIGFFGIGFKSVFLVSNKPEIYSANFSFYYDDKTLIVPHWIENISPSIRKKLDSLGEKGALVVIPFKDKKDNYDLITQHLKKLSGSLLLYLNNLKKFVLNGEEYAINDIGSNLFEVKDRNEEPTLWKSYHKILQIPRDMRDFLGEDRGIKDIDKRVKEKEKIVLTFEVTKEGRVKPNQMGRLYAFLPTEVKTGFIFNIQADFSVNIERTALRATGRKWNRWLLSNVHRCISPIIQDFKNQPTVRTEFYKVLPLEDSERPEYLNIVKEKIDEYIRKTNSILVKTRKSKKYPDGAMWVKPEQAVICEPRFQRLFDGKDLEHVFGRRKYYVATDEIAVEGRRYIEEVVDDELSFDEVLKLLRKSRWISERKLKNRRNPERWVGDLFIYFASELERIRNEASYWERSSKTNDFLRKLSNVKFILTEDEKLRKPEKIFLPPSEDIDIPSHLRKKYAIVNRKLVRYLEGRGLKSETERGQRKKGLELLKQIASELSPVTIVKEIINPAFSMDNWREYTDSQLIKYIDFIRKHEDCWITGRIKVKVETDGGTRLYKAPGELFLGTKYGNEFDLDVLYKGYKDNNFVSLDYIRKLIESDSEKAKTQINSWKNFFINIGVKEIPEIQKHAEESISREVIEKELAYPEDTVRSTFSTSSYPGYERKDYDLDNGLKKIISDCLNGVVKDSNRRLKILIRILDRRWGYYSKYLVAQYGWHGCNQSGRTYEPLRLSSFAKILKDENWVPTKDGNHLKPEAVALGELKGIVDVPVIDYKISNEDFKEFLQNLGLQTKPSVEGAIARLKALVGQNEKGIERFIKIYRYLAQHEKQKKKIREELEDVLCIFVPNHDKKYWKTSEVFWKGDSSFLEWKIDLERVYPEDLKDFFLNFLNVKESPIDMDYVDFLKDYLWKQEELTGREKSALKTVYHHLDYMITTAKWKKSRLWRELKADFKILCEDNYWVRTDNEIFYNDNDELYNLFRNNRDIVFAYISKSIEVKDLFAELAIKGLSESYVEKCNVWGEQIIAKEEYGNEIGRMGKYIANFAKEKNPMEFNKLNNEGVFSLLNEIEVKFVENLEVNAFVGNHGVYLGKRLSFYSWRDSENCLYLKKSLKDDEGSCFEHTGIAFSNAFGRIEGLEIFIPYIAGKEEEQIIQSMENFGIPVRDIKIKEGEKKKEIPKKEEKTIWEKPKREYGEPPREWKPECRPEQADVNIVVYEPKETSPPRVGSEDKKRSVPSPRDRMLSHGPSTKHEKTDKSDEKDMKEIGKWGEGYVYSCLQKQKSKEYPGAELIETEEGFNLEKDGKILVEVIWWNKYSDQGIGYDIELFENDIRQYIEVKSTITEEVHTFNLSKAQWDMMQKEGDNFWIYRVYNTGCEKRVKCKPIRNPAKLMKEGKIAAYPIQIEI